MVWFLCEGLLFVVVSLCFTTCLSQSCFYPDGALAAADVPCSSDKHTPCCGKDNICLSNGLCLDSGRQPYSLSRGSCTDDSWGSSCPSQCLSLSFNESGCTIVNLSSFDNVALYCCNSIMANGATTTCANNEDPFTVDDGQMIFGRAGLVNGTNSSVAGGKMSATPATSTTPTRASAATATTPQRPMACTDLSHNTAIGVGIGVPLGVIALAGAAWALWERRQKNRLIAQMAIPVPASMAYTDSYKSPVKSSGNLVQGPAELD